MTPNHALEPTRNHVGGIFRKAAAARLRAIVGRRERI
jgi:hypothetical protein